MARETFPFTSSTLRSLRLQQEWLEWEDRRRAAAWQRFNRRCPPSTRTQLTRTSCYCRDPAVHNALFVGDLQRIQALFQDEATANMIVETVSDQLAWSAELGKGHQEGTYMGRKRAMKRMSLGKHFRHHSLPTAGIDTKMGPPPFPQWRMFPKFLGNTVQLTPPYFLLFFLVEEQ